MEMINSLWCYYNITLQTYSKYPCHFHIWIANIPLFDYLNVNLRIFSVTHFVNLYKQVTPKLNRSVNIGIYMYNCQSMTINTQITPYPSLKSRHSPWHGTFTCVTLLVSDEVHYSPSHFKMRVRLDVVGSYQYNQHCLYCCYI